MKHIKLILSALIFMGFAQIGAAQAPDNNGRPADLKPNPPLLEKSKPNPSSTEEAKVHDFDVAPPNFDDMPNLIFPQDLLALQDELANSPSNEDLAKSVAELQSQLGQLVQTLEELRLENKTMRTNLGNCCSSNELELTAADAYLMQNAPNPYRESTQIKFFVPKNLINVWIEIHDTQGKLLNAYEILDRGLSTLMVDANDLNPGAYVYTLTVDGKMIDSKVMILKQ